jgi:hypothetical protein
MKIFFIFIKGNSNVNTITHCTRVPVSFSLNSGGKEHLEGTLWVISQVKPQ